MSKIIIIIIILIMPDIINHGLRRVFYVRQRKQMSLCYYDHDVLHGVTPLNPLNII